MQMVLHRDGMQVDIGILVPIKSDMSLEEDWDGVLIWQNGGKGGNISPPGDAIQKRICDQQPDSFLSHFLSHGIPEART